MNLLAIVLIQGVDEMVAVEMTTGALVFMLACMAAVTGLVAWCFSRILNTKDHFDPDGTGPAQPPVAGREDRAV